MAEQTLRERYPEAIEAVRAFFGQFYGAEITISEEFGAARVLFVVGPGKKIVAVSEDFLTDADPVAVRERLAAWNVAHLSRTLERGCVLSVTGDGPEEEREAAF